MIVNPFKGIFAPMTPEMRYRVRTPESEARRHKGPSLAELRKLAEEAIREPDGIHLGPLSHAERAKILLAAKR